jgi:DNA-binding HxlR family transcriptional regulator
VKAAPTIQPALGVVVRSCPASRAAAVIGDAWVQVILRAAFSGVSHFSGFLDRIGISRTVLADRLRRMVDAGLIETYASRDGAAHRAYRLTEKGRDTIGIVLVQDAWERLFGSDDAIAGLADYRRVDSDSAVRPVVLNRAQGAIVEARRLNYLLVRETVEHQPAATTRRKSTGEPTSPTALTSVAVLGDTWSWMILIAAFFRVRRFDEFIDTLGIASNVLSDRLQRLLAADLLVRERYSRTPDRYEYRLAIAGRALHPLFCAIYGWGERWLYPDETPPMQLFDMITGERITPVVCDESSGLPIDARLLRPARVAIAA